MAENRQNYDNLLISCVKEPTKDTTLEKVDFLKARAISAVCSSRQLQEHLTSNTHYDLIDLTSQKSENSYPIKEILALLAVLSFCFVFHRRGVVLNVFLFLWQVHRLYL